METEKVLQSIEKLADKLGVEAKQLFAYYVKNAKITKYVFWIYMLISIALIAASSYMLFKSYIPVCEYEAEFVDFILFIFGIVFGAVGVIILFAEIFSIQELINSYVNPEYEASEDLFGTIFKD